MTDTPDKVYPVLYADPPWRYDFSKSASRKIENQYPTMSIEDIALLPVPAAANAVLFLWATAPKLQEALQVMAAWRFTYKSNAIWDKEIIGMGYWFRGQHELLLVGTKGKFSPPQPSSRHSSIFHARRTRHSAKPEVVRQHIEIMFPLLPKVELFAREPHIGWDVWGNEIDAL